MIDCLFGRAPGENIEWLLRATWSVCRKEKPELYRTTMLEY